jgi:hypothetical protein
MFKIAVGRHDRRVDLLGQAMKRGTVVTCRGVPQRLWLDEQVALNHP